VSEGGGGGGGDRTQEHDVRVDGDTADIETGQFLIIKRCLCPIVFCNYKCPMSDLSPKVLSFSHSYVTKRNEIIHNPQSQWTLNNTV